VTVAEIQDACEAIRRANRKRDYWELLLLSAIFGRPLLGTRELRLPREWKTDYTAYLGHSTIQRWKLEWYVRWAGWRCVGVRA